MPKAKLHAVVRIYKVYPCRHPELAVTGEAYSESQIKNWVLKIVREQDPCVKGWPCVKKESDLVAEIIGYKPFTPEQIRKAIGICEEQQLLPL